MILNVLYILAAILLLSLIVIAHEFGHYFVGRLCGIGVVEFSVGFGPRLLGWTRKGIQYSLRAFPLGGFCKFVGEDADDKAPNAINNQRVWKRFLTVLAGPVMNFVLALVVMVIILTSFSFMEGRPWIYSVSEGIPAAAVGLQKGDVVTMVNGEKISYDAAGAEKMRERIIAAGEQEMTLGVLRDGKEMTISITPAEVVLQDGSIVPQIGIVFGGRYYTLWEAIRYAPAVTADTMGVMLDSLKNLVFTGEGMKDTMGPVGIISFVSTTVREGMYMVWNLLFIISLNLGIVNLLPIPALDGGRLVFLLVEGIRRKPIPPEKEGMVHTIGFMLLLLLIVVFTYQDIVRLIAG